MKLVVAGVLAFVCGCMSPPIPIGAGKSPEEAQHMRLGKLWPAQLVAEGKWTGEVHVAKVRVWADDQYRAQNVRWEHTFQEELDYANSVLAPMLGVRLEAEYRVWPRHAPAGTLDDALVALAQQDPGDDVLSVIGLTSSLGLASATFDKIGLANLPGRHLVLRGYADIEERQAFAFELRDLRPDERESLSEARRRHKTAALLLHEIGHNLGAPHDPGEDAIMNPLYSNHAASFSASERALMLRTLDARLKRPGERGASATAVTTLVRAPAAHHPSLVVVVAASGDTVVDDKPVGEAELDGLLRQAFVGDHETEVVIKLARHVPHDVMIKLLDRAKAAGLHRISMGTSDGP